MTAPHARTIILVTCHDLGRRLGCYGVRGPLTPHLDAFAANAVVFDAAFTVASQCSPSRAALATGRYPHRNGVMGLAHPPFGWDLHPDVKHIAQLLGERDFETRCFGFQHVSPADERLGFDSIEGPEDARPLGEKVAAFLRQRDHTTPLYLEVNIHQPHRPFARGGVEPLAGDRDRPTYLADTPRVRDELALLDGAIAHADDAFGAIIAALRETGLDDEALVVFTTDHGLAMPRAKCTMYDPGIETALLVRWPRAGWSGGRRIDDLVSNVDVLPTLLEAVDGLSSDQPQATAGADLDGISLAGLLAGDPRAARRQHVFAAKTYHSYYDPMRAVRTARHKYICNFGSSFAVEVPLDMLADGVPAPGQGTAPHGCCDETEHPLVELYDLVADPAEYRNLAGDPSVADVEHELRQLLHAWMVETDDPLLNGPVASPAEEAARSVIARPVDVRVPTPV